MRRHFSLLPLLALVLLIGLPPGAYAAGDVRVSMDAGRVTVSAHDATLKEILQAWARAGQTVIINADAIAADAPVTLELTNVKEADALAVLLRPLSGYLTMRRAAPAPSVSQYDRIVLLPSSVANHDSAIINTPAPPPFQQAPPPQTVVINGVARLIGPNGAIVEDDQQGAPPPVNVPRGFTRGDAPGPPPPQGVPAAQPPAQTTPAGATTPGVIITPKAPTPGAPTQR